MKLVLAAYRSAKPKFEVRGWKALAAKRGMSEATAKQRFGNLKNKYLDEKAEAAQGAPATTASTTAASAATGSSVSGPSAGASTVNAPSVSAPVVTATTDSVTLPARRNAPRAAKSGTKRTNSNHDEDDQGDENDMPPPPPKRPRRSTRSTAKDKTSSATMIAAEDNEGGEDDKNPVPVHHRFADPKPYVSPSRGRSTASTAHAQPNPAAAPTRSEMKARHELYETNRLKWGFPRGGPVPLDDAGTLWISPGEGLEQARENARKNTRDLWEVFDKLPKESQDKLIRERKQEEEAKAKSEDESKEDDKKQE
ncbi:hypothetical protein PG991_010821 [Apiospora marii]|uniref:HMG box domain-containing protein n=1 Tax=Apiospora marii TaxID=335849 RepID=A0ABR1RCS6_9PEZI